MTVKYSASLGGFFDTRIHGAAIPLDAVDISEEYHASLLLAESIVPDEHGYPIATALPKPSRTKSSLLADLATKRWQVETGGIIVAGIHIATDRVSQTQLNTVYTSLKMGLIVDTPWKDADGLFTAMTLSEIEPVVQAVATHVHTCFTVEEAHNEAINALQEQVELDTYDINTGWPETLS